MEECRYIGEWIRELHIVEVQGYSKGVMCVAVAALVCSFGDGACIIDK